MNVFKNIIRAFVVIFFITTNTLILRIFDMNERSFVTVGVPVYNEAKYLRETLQSVVNQTYKDILILVSDNASTDNSAEIVEEFAKKDLRIQLIRQPENIGATENFKFLIDRAETDFFMWMGAHDLLSETYIEQCVNILEDDHNAVLAYHKAVFFEETISKLGKLTYSEIDTKNLSTTFRLNKIINVTGSCTAIHGVFRTKVAKQLPFVKMIGPDHLMLFATAAQGHIRQIDTVGFFRRDVHKHETLDQRRLRYEQFKMFTAKRFTPSAHFAKEHIRYTFKIKQLNIILKLFISLNIIFRVLGNYFIFEVLKLRKNN